MLNTEYKHKKRCQHISNLSVLFYFSVAYTQIPSVLLLIVPIFTYIVIVMLPTSDFTMSIFEMHQGYAERCRDFDKEQSPVTVSVCRE